MSWLATGQDRILPKISGPTGHFGTYTHGYCVTLYLDSRTQKLFFPFWAGYFYVVQPDLKLTAILLHQDQENEPLHPANEAFDWFVSIHSSAKRGRRTSF